MKSDIKITICLIALIVEGQGVRQNELFNGIGNSKNQKNIYDYNQKKIVNDIQKLTTKYRIFVSTIFYTINSTNINLNISS